MKPTLFDRFIEKGLTLGSVESITGGLFGSWITKYAHASQFYCGGLIVYNNQAKERLAHVKKENLMEYKAISKEIVIELANNVLNQLDCDVVIGFVGNAGPSAQDDELIGSTYMAIASKTDTIVYHDQLDGNRNDIQNQLMQLADIRLNIWLDKQ